MAGVSRQKQKLLQMKQLFEQRTDETHSITGNQLIDILGQMGIKAERKTIYDDVETLRDSGMKLETTKNGHSNAYYLAERLFTDDELKLLCDLVASSKYITIKRSNEIIRKLQTMTSEYKSPSLKRSVHIENRIKGSGENVYRTVDFIHDAMAADNEVELLYSDKSEKKKSVRLVISPYKVVWENERYYIICCCTGGAENSICKLKVECMSELAMSKNKRHSLTAEEEEQVRALRASENQA